MLQEGKDFQAISKALKTKSVDSCKKRVFVIRRNMLKYHHHFKFPIEKKLMDLIQTVEVDEPIVIQTTRKNDDRWRASEHQKWAKMFKEGKSFQSIAEEIGTKTER